MKINFNQPIKQLDGKVVKDSTGELTLKSIAIGALSNIGQDENPSAEEKVKWYDLTLKIYNAKGELDVSVEDVALLKARIGKGFVPLVVGRAYEMLDPK